MTIVTARAIATVDGVVTISPRETIMTKVAMRDVLAGVRDSVTDPVMRLALSLAASLVVSKLSGSRVSWLMAMLRDMSYSCDCRGQDVSAALLRSVASAIYSG